MAALRFATRLLINSSYTVELTPNLGYVHSKRFTSYTPKVYGMFL